MAEYYARSVVAETVEAIRNLNLITERAMTFGPIPPGVTVYRHTSSGQITWLELPDPEKPAPKIYFKPGGIRYLPVGELPRWRRDTLYGGT